MDPYHQKDVTQNVGLPDQQDEYTVLNLDSQQVYVDSNEYQLQTSNTDPLSNNPQPPQMSTQVTSPISSFVGQSQSPQTPQTYREYSTTSDDRGAKSLEQPSPEPHSSRMSSANTTKLAAVRKPKFQKEKKTMDPHGLEKPVSDYALFFGDTQAAIKAQNPNASFDQIEKIVTSMWAVLAPEHRDVYVEKAAAANAAYLRNLAAHRAPPPTQPVQHSPQSQLNRVSPIPHTSSQQISQGLPTQQSNQQNQYMATQQSQVPSQHIQHINYGQYAQPQSSHQINTSNINQNDPNFYGYDRSQLMESKDIQMGTMQSNLHLVTGGGVDQATGITPTDTYQSNVQQKCIRNGCTNPAIKSEDWEDEYCSNECVILHCGGVFKKWVRENDQQHQ